MLEWLKSVWRAERRMVSRILWLQTERLGERCLIPGRGKGFFFSSLCAQTSSEAYPACCPMEVLFPWVKRGRGVTLITQPHLVPTSRMSRSCISFLPCRLNGNSGQIYFTFINLEVGCVNVDPMWSYRRLLTFPRNLLAPSWYEALGCQTPQCECRVCVTVLWNTLKNVSLLHE
jgi:hypothetical protein